MPGRDLQRGAIVNETDLPDDVIEDAVTTYIEEHASVLGVSRGSTFQNYANEGSLLNRSKFRTPGNVFEEIMLARDLAERDDDVGAAMGTMIATAFEEGMRNVHQDEVTVALFDKAAKHAKLDAQFPEMYRELLIAGSVTTATIFQRTSIQFQPQGAERQRTRGLVVPRIGILPAEHIRVVDEDIFGTGTLAYVPMTGAQERWLREMFADETTPARRAEMRRLNPVLAALLTEQIRVPWQDVAISSLEHPDPPLGDYMYKLNPSMVARVTFPKGAWRYPRPLLTRNFALLEAKRLLNIMDFALLQGGANFLVIVKKGTDQKPAKQDEIDNLRETIKRATRTGVVVGDHRLSVEIITPNLTELLNESKRKLVGRKLAMALMRVPEASVDNPGTEGMKVEVEFATRVISNDRRLLRRHIENEVYEEIVNRNPNHFASGPASIWQPKLVLQGTNYFTDYILKLRDRGDISRRSTIEAGGFDYDAEVQQRKREKASGDDRALTPPPVPFTATSGGAGPQDNGGGRPAGSGPNNGAAGARQRASSGPDRARPTRVIAQNAGETVRAMYEEEVGTYWIGELTYAVLEQFPDHEDGRVTTLERAALDEIGAALADGGEWPGPVQAGPVTIVCVNPEYEIENLRAVRLTDEISMFVGARRDDGALVARAFGYRGLGSPLLAEETALRWGFTPRPLLEAPAAGEQ